MNQDKQILPNYCIKRILQLYITGRGSLEYHLIVELITCVSLVCKEWGSWVRSGSGIHIPMILVTNTTTQSLKRLVKTLGFDISRTLFKSLTSRYYYSKINSTTFILDDSPSSLVVIPIESSSSSTTSFPSTSSLSSLKPTTSISISPLNEIPNNILLNNDGNVYDIKEMMFGSMSTSYNLKIFTDTIDKVMQKFSQVNNVTIRYSDYNANHYNVGLTHILENYGERINILSIYHSIPLSVIPAFSNLTNIVSLCMMDENRDPNNNAILITAISSLVSLETLDISISFNSQAVYLNFKNFMATTKITKLSLSSIVALGYQFSDLGLIINDSIETLIFQIQQDIDLNLFRLGPQLKYLQCRITTTYSLTGLLGLQYNQNNLELNLKCGNTNKVIESLLTWKWTQNIVEMELSPIPMPILFSPDSVSLFNIKNLPRLKSLRFDIADYEYDSKEPLFNMDPASTELVPLPLVKSLSTLSNTLTFTIYLSHSTTKSRPLVYHFCIHILKEMAIKSFLIFYSLPNEYNIFYTDPHRKNLLKSTVKNSNIDHVQLSTPLMYYPVGFRDLLTKM